MIAIGSEILDQSQCEVANGLEKIISHLHYLANIIAAQRQPRLFVCVRIDAGRE